MRIGGIVPCSFVDFPGHTCAAIFTQGCNFRCPFCHNGHLIPPVSLTGDLLDAEEVVTRLSRRVGMLDGVAISGGEPTLQEGLGEFLRRIKALGFRTKLDTNGSKPEVIYGLLGARLLDYVAMDVKAPEREYDRLCGVKAPIDKIKESIRLIAASGIDHEFRTTVADDLLSPVDVEEISALIPPGSPHKLQPLRRENALDPDLRTAAS